MRSSAMAAARSRPGSTAPGLVRLLYHLIHATAQGELDPALAADLGRDIVGEINRVRLAAAPRDPDMELLREAESRFENTVLQAHGALLAHARNRLLHEEAG